MQRRHFAVAIAAALLLIILLPDVAVAWTPGTHIFLGESVLANLSQLPAQIADLLRAYPFDFLYGNIAADTSIAKKYAPVGRHCHSWHVGQEIVERAESDALRSFGLGYLAHLAADSVAHNFYVPRQLVVTSTTIALGHSYWESRFETHLGEHYARTAMDVIRMDHTGADTLLDRVLAPTIFSVRTSRRLFRGMVGLTETQSWQRAFRVLADTSRWDVTDEMVETHMGVAFQLVMEVLAEEDSLAHRLDPSGEASLSLAKRMRIDVMRSRLPRDPTRLSAVASRHFGLPTYHLDHWERSVHDRPWWDRQSDSGAATAGGG
ncbi:MAG: zinc dependent phospholipase C family protein [Gemmatimonadales bacterium]|nr:zinc dependent phospholipase C family protein [Gemmatimonadales bacterium]